ICRTDADKLRPRHRMRLRQERVRADPLSQRRRRLRWLRHRPRADRVGPGGHHAALPGIPLPASRPVQQRLQSILHGPASFTPIPTHYTRDYFSLAVSLSTPLRRFDSIRFLEETHRVLRRGGRALFSFFILDDSTSALMNAGGTTFNFGFEVDPPDVFTTNE